MKVMKVMNSLLSFFITFHNIMKKWEKNEFITVHFFVTFHYITKQDDWTHTYSNWITWNYHLKWDKSNEQFYRICHVFGDVHIFGSPVFQVPREICVNHYEKNVSSSAEMHPRAKLPITDPLKFWSPFSWVPTLYQLLSKSRKMALAL